MFVSKERPEALDGLLKKSSEELTAEPTDLPLSKAKLVRTFMPGSSPAAIAVALPGGHAYCWDAGNCRLRYAWQGWIHPTAWQLWTLAHATDLARPRLLPGASVSVSLYG